MYRYDALDRAFVRSRVDEYRDQTQRYLDGQLSDDEFLQLRLRNGTRMVAKFNLTHTVADVRAFIAKVGAAGDGAYTLQLAGFPPEQLTDETRAVGDGLANAVVIQR